MKCPVCRKPMLCTGDIINPTWSCKTHETFSNSWMIGFWFGYETAIKDVEESSLFKIMEEDVIGGAE